MPVRVACGPAAMRRASSRVRKVRFASDGHRREVGAIVTAAAFLRCKALPSLSGPQLPVAQCRSRRVVVRERASSRKPLHAAHRG